METTQRCFELLQAGNMEGLRKAIEQDASASDARDANGVTLLMHCLYRGRRDLAQLIAGTKKKALDIFEATSLGRLDRLKECLGDKAAIDARSGDDDLDRHGA